MTQSLRWLRLLSLSLLLCALSRAPLVLAQEAPQVAAVAPVPAVSAVHTLIVEPDDKRSAILSAINAAEKTITLTIYEINDTEILMALANAQRRGVDVRILYNFYSFECMGRGDVNGPYIRQLTAAGVQARQAPVTFTVTHQKTFTFDDSLAIIMTFNLQPGYFSTTRDFGIITTDAAEIAEIKSVFEADWASQAVTPSLASLVWSPVNSRAKILAAINQAEKTLEVYNEESADAGCLAALKAAAARGVAVRFITAVLDSKGVDGNAVHRAALNQAGVQARSASFLYIHAKMVLSDYGTPKAAAFLGSENFSMTSLDKNRELGILVSEPAILDRLHATFEEDWPKAQ